MREKRRTRDVCRNAPVVTPPTHSQQGPRSGENVLRKREQKEADTQHTSKAAAKRGRREGRKYAAMLAGSAYIVHTENHAMLPVFGRVHLLKGENNM